ncbi:NAD(P)/FAD-dependent oxidoreductase [Microbacterium sp. ASV49]|uniref:FAD-binding oxidoreductase n=1 Tax=Microbacterium candidum TaxID=3041922 RepID=A0ABT7MXU3_9MICO|nr:FAD-binding oxidoreductase [Microbacterium sp. ASV49]MDL9979264.1 FAD-binding oxidoreductase [Microbacterium sp. ASV49]
MTDQQPDHVVVLGGGIFGSSSAAQLARRGVRVTLVTEGALASGASGRSLAWLNAAWKWPQPYYAIRVAGIDRWRTWAARHPGSFRYLRFTGGLMWADEDDGESLRDLYALQRDRGYDAQWVDRDRISRVAPGVDPSAVAAEGAIFNPGEGWVNLPSVIRLLADEVVELGGTIVEDAGPSQPVVLDGRATGVRTAAGHEITADAVLLATGPSVPHQLTELGVRIGTSSPPAFVAFTAPIDIPLEVTLNTPHVAIRRTVDGGIAMDSGWSERSIQVAEDGSLQIADEVVDRLMDEAARVLEGHPKLELVRIGSGYKPVPADGEPVYGRIAQVPGLYVAFSHSGATQGLIAGELIADEIATGYVSPLMAPFRPERFGQWASGMAGDLLSKTNKLS